MNTAAAHVGQSPAGAPAVPGVSVLSELGRGARSVVYRVRHRGTDLAMKVLHAPLHADHRTLAAFRREAALLALADHPGLPQVHDVGEVDGRPYLIMDLIEGRELAAALRPGPLAEDDILRLGIEVAEALGAVHRVGLVHRDVKPQNILLTTGGRARLIDLGMAARTSADLSDVVAGTLTYAAPEQAGTLKRPVDARADLYSLGVVLYECAAGRAPFSSADVGELLRMHATLPPPDLHAVRDDLSPTLTKIIYRLLAKDPDDRYATCASLIADLRTLTDDPTTDFPPGRADADHAGRAEADFVGRATELTELHSRWERALAGSGALALVHGASGTGKTRLTGEFAARLDRTGLPVLTAACGHAASPLAPLAGAVERYLAVVARRDAGARTEALEWVRSAAGAAAPYLRRLTPALAEVLTDGDETVDDQPDGYIRAVAGFLADLARTAGGGLLVFDDAESADSATVRVLHLLAAQLADAPLLLIVTTGDAAASKRREVLPADTVDADLALGPLDRDALLRLVSSLAGRLRLEPSLIDRIVARCGGTPLGVIEYVGAVLDAGLVLPRWGTWVLDEAGLDSLDLPTDVLGLLLRRVDDLGAPTRELLTAAAVVGMRFTRALARETAGLAPDDGAPLLDQAVAHGVLDRYDGGYTFVHDRIRRALLDGLPADRLRDLHQRAADGIGHGGATEPAQRYAVARHLLAGHPDRDRARTSAACRAAGQLALAEHGAAEAVEFLEAAIAYADGLSPAEHSALHEALGIAHHRAGNLAQALETLSVALDTAPTGIDRARILEQQAKQHLAYWNTDTAVDAITRAMAELGRPLPRNPVWRALTAAAMYVAAIVTERTGIGFGTRDPAKRAWYRQRANLYETGFDSAVRGLRLGLCMVFNARRRYAATRLGPSHEYLRALGSVAGTIWLFVGHRKSRGLARATALAQRQGDPVATAYIESLHHTVATQVVTDPDTEALLRWLEQYGAFTEFVYAIDIAQASSFRLLTRGRAVEAVAATQRAHARLGATDLAAHPVGHVGNALAAALGRPVDAAASLRLLDENGAFHDLAGRIYLLNACAILAVEQREYGEIFDRIASDVAALKVRHPLMVIHSLRGLWAYIAYGRLEQARAATGADRARALAEVRRALRVLRQVAWGPGPGGQYKAHLLVGRAHLRLLEGDPKGALDRLAAVDRQLIGQDVPLAGYEAARIRARALAELGRTIEATAAAATALSIAQQLNLPHRVEWVRAEFGVDSATTTSTGSSTRSMAFGGVTSTVNGASGADGRRLAALEKLSVTASRILDPDELTRVALDETIRILSAERAYLFLTDDDGRLKPHRGRDAAGADLDELADYGSTVVERVRQSREPVIVTGTDEGAALGSKSAVAHGLRSIIAAPLLFDGRLLGVVYLDSRVAKGMFTASDAGILTAMTNHIAAALETARAAQLAVAVQAAEQQRDVADKMREAMLELSSSLHPDDVLHRLHLNFRRLLPGDASFLIRVRGDKLAVTSGGQPDAEPRLVAAEAGLARILAGDSPSAGNGDTAPAEPVIFGEPSMDSSWLVAPLHTRDGLAGAVVVTAERPDVYGTTEVQLAAALAGQALVAYDNARLFSQVERMATTDALTGVDNRRHFFTMAERDVAQASDAGATLMAVMLDIDHFKRINDERGHQVGDQVIAAVAGRLRQTLRDTDRLGRYGGEEFAILLSEPVQPLAERLRLAVAGTPVTTDVGPVSVTISVGVCVFDASRLALTEALKRADAALYRAKAGGRDRVVIDEVGDRWAADPGQA